MAGASSCVEDAQGFFPVRRGDHVVAPLAQKRLQEPPRHRVVLGDQNPFVVRLLLVGVSWSSPYLIRPMAPSVSRGPARRFADEIGRGPAGTLSNSTLQPADFLPGIACNAGGRERACSSNADAALERPIAPMLAAALFIVCAIRSSSAPSPLRWASRISLACRVYSPKKVIISSCMSSRSPSTRSSAAAMSRHTALDRTSAHRG